MNYLITHPIVGLAVASAAVALMLAWLIFILYRRWNGVFGPRPATGNDVLAGVLNALRGLEARLDAAEPRIEALEAVGKIAVQKVGFMRFNPFAHTGGDQSFALALLDSENNGVIISSLYTREGVRVYAKDVQRGVSKHQLSEEERRVLAQATSTKS